jgi:enhancing lycopene biosynthesis protein 2
MDGAEIYESVLTLLTLDRHGISYQCFAPDIPQMHVVNHATGNVVPETRNVLTEAARLARGQIKALDLEAVDKHDAFIFPGGFGAAKNYCDWAVKGEACEMNPLMEAFMRRVVERKKPIGVICIAPLVLARALKGTQVHPKLTVGAASGAAKGVEAFGSEHVVCGVKEIVVDRTNRIVSTPAYMYDAKISDVAIGIDALVQEVIALMA